jgi:hypothetical protein
MERMMTNSTEPMINKFRNFETDFVFRWLEQKQIIKVQEIRKKYVHSEHPLVEFSGALQEWFESDILPQDEVIDKVISEPFTTLLFASIGEIDWWEIAKAFLQKRDWNGQQT